VCVECAWRVAADAWCVVVLWWCRGGCVLCVPHTPCGTRHTLRGHFSLCCQFFQASTNASWLCPAAIACHSDNHTTRDFHPRTPQTPCPQTLDQQIRSLKRAADAHKQTNGPHWHAPHAVTLGKPGPAAGVLVSVCAAHRRWPLIVAAAAVGVRAVPAACALRHMQLDDAIAAIAHTPPAPVTVFPVRQQAEVARRGRSMRRCCPAPLLGRRASCWRARCKQPQCASRRWHCCTTALVYVCVRARACVPRPTALTAPSACTVLLQVQAGQRARPAAVCHPVFPKRGSRRRARRRGVVACRRGGGAARRQRRHGCGPGGRVEQGRSHPPDRLDTAVQRRRCCCRGRGVLERQGRAGGVGWGGVVRACACV
jgi:hypothetical protein